MLSTNIVTGVLYIQPLGSCIRLPSSNRPLIRLSGPPFGKTLRRGDLFNLCSLFWGPPVLLIGQYREKLRLIFEFILCAC